MPKTDQAQERKRLMVVEDDQTVRGMLQASLGRRYEVIGLPNGEGAEQQRPMNPVSQPADPAGLRVIMLYKGIKGTAELILAATCLALLFGSGFDLAMDFAQNLREHLVQGWSIRLADWALDAATPRMVRLIGLALACDGAMTLGEWWCLRQRHPWTEWLVVASSGSLLPFEVLELFRGIRLGRVLVFVLNATIVAYLAARRLAKAA